MQQAADAVPVFSPEMLEFTRWVADYYFCGPKPFMVNVYQGLVSWAVPASQVHFEFFGPREELEQAVA